MLLIILCTYFQLPLSSYGTTTYYSFPIVHLPLQDIGTYIFSIYVPMNVSILYLIMFVYSPDKERVLPKPVEFLANCFIYLFIL